MLRDSFDRVIRNLRVSVTDRCNFRCTYCMPEDGMEWIPREQILRFEEICRVVEISLRLGVRKVRLTGGEPLVRRELPVLVRKLRALESLEDLALTTNGWLLEEQAPRLAAAGLARVNVSLDSLEEETFRRLARRGSVERVLAGIDAALHHFPGAVKVNAVILRGINDGEIESFAELARRERVEMRFIEYMPLDADARWTWNLLLGGDEIRRRIHAVHPLEEVPSPRGAAPAQDYRFRDGIGGRVGFINSVTEPFCGNCDRIRLTADGKLRTCLFSTRETDLAALLRSGASDATIAAAIADAVSHKEAGHKIGRTDFVPASRSMSQIGG